MITSAFTCTGPYAILIMLGIKRVENRSMMPVPAKGRCAVSCSKSFNVAEYGAFAQWAAVNLPPDDFELIPAWGDVKDWPGKVIGCCDYSADGKFDKTGQTRFIKFSGLDYVKPLTWDEGYRYWWELSNVVCFDHQIPCRGNVGMWQMPPDLAAQVSAADALTACVIIGAS